MFLPLDFCKLVGDVLYLVECEGETLNQVGPQVLITDLKVLIVSDDTHGHLCAVQHPVQFLPALSKGFLQLGNMTCPSFLIYSHNITWSAFMPFFQDMTVNTRKEEKNKEFNIKRKEKKHRHMLPKVTGCT